jgi:3-hydroxyisobutyrate dehydrogenase-like beta-hydroxyacid dehydrogenase
VRLAVLHPGAMGVTVGAALSRAGHSVRWLVEGRSPATTARAEEAGLEPCNSLAELVANSDGIVSVCPPDAALAVADRVVEAGFSGLYVDANAVAPATARALAERVGSGFVDGGIVGPPAHRAGTTRLYLSGAAAEAVAGWFADGLLEARVIPGPPGAASALKMCYAAYTKGTSALLLAIRALAEAEGVTEGLLGEWSLSQPGLEGRSEAAARGSAPKAWRFSGEMREIAATFAARDLPDGFHLAAAAVYERLADFKDAEAPELDAVLEMLVAGRS